MSQRTFNESLYREHLEEVTSLVQMRASWLSDGESTPDDIAGLEGRIEAHVDGLCLGGHEALDAVRDATRPDDPWSFYAWIAVACRADEPGRLRKALARMERFCALNGDDLDPSMIRRAVADALIHHLPHDRLDLLAHTLHLAPPHIALVLAQCIEARRRPRAEHEPASELRRVVSPGPSRPVGALP